jgi:hypothetical protein
MNTRAPDLIAETARDLLARPHTQKELEEKLFTLARGCYMPEGRADVVPVRRMPAAGEILPPQQRATWARARTPYDA